MEWLYISACRNANPAGFDIDLLHTLYFSNALQLNIVIIALITTLLFPVAIILELSFARTLATLPGARYFKHRHNTIIRKKLAGLIRFRKYYYGPRAR